MIKGLPALAVTGLALALVPAIASAEPTDSPDGGSKCTFTVSAPQAAKLPGPGNATGVTATLTWNACTGSAIPVFATACVSSATSNGRCEQSDAWNSVFAIYPTQNPTGIFTVNSQGCYRDVRLQATLICHTAQQTATL